MKEEHLQHLKRSGFKTPEGYFGTLETKLLETLETQSALHNVTHPGFKTPEDYFSSLEDRIIGQVSETKKPKVIALSRQKAVLYLSSIAAAVLLFFNLSIFKTTPSFESLETASVEAYLIDENISSYEIAALLSDEQINTTIDLDLDIDQANIETYLLEHADIDDLLIE